jgi:hypothetical protein
MQNTLLESDACAGLLLMHIGKDGSRTFRNHSCHFEEGSQTSFRTITGGKSSNQSSWGVRIRAVPPSKEERTDQGICSGSLTVRYFVPHDFPWRLLAAKAATAASLDFSHVGIVKK